MKCSLLFIISFTLFVLSASGQTPDYSKWLRTMTLEGQTITKLRIPETNFRPPLFGYISDAQYLLDMLPNYFKMYNPNQFMDLKRNIETDCERIEKEDASFPVHYYREEVKAFIDLQVLLKQRKEAEEKAKIAREKQERDQRMLKQLIDGGYAWINRDSINVRSKPDSKSFVMGQLDRLSAVNAYEVDKKTDWVEVQFDGHSGYMLRKFVTPDWEDIALTGNDSTVLLIGPHAFFTPTAAYTAQLERAEAAEQERNARAAGIVPNRKYHRGPKGGCYILHSDGTKEYVDRSLCN